MLVSRMVEVGCSVPGGGQQAGQASQARSGLVSGRQPQSLIPAAVTAARAADAAVVFVNRVAGEGMDHDG
ncbi:hypothetical protein ABZS79_17215 [Streptomyces griseoloalbus]|uniref:hypothetical protein n=1 Tax=Streptomyces griseoloalbus TaxID=67303 RepID=UPI0033B752C8